MKIKRKNYRKNFYLFNWLCKYLFFLILFIGTCVSCQTLFKKKIVIPNNLSSYKKGTFSGTVVVSQKENKGYFNADVLISNKNKLRMDLSIFHGIPVFTLLTENKEIIFLFLQKREFYKGHKVNNALSAFFPKDLKFSVFKEIFFDRKPEGKNWVCKVNEQNLPLRCQNLKWTIQWERKGKRGLFLKSSDFNFTFRYSSFSPEVNDSLFNIKIPENFKQILLLK